MMMDEAKDGLVQDFVKLTVWFQNSVSCKQSFCLQILAQFICYFIPTSLLTLELDQGRDIHK